MQLFILLNTDINFAQPAAADINIKDPGSS